MSAQVLAVKEKVQRWLADWLDGIEIDRDGDFNLRYGSTRVWIAVKPFGEDGTVVRVFAYLNSKVPASPGLFEYVATEGSAYHFGSMRCYRHDNGVNVFFSHGLLGEYLDPEELKSCISAVAASADKVDDEISKKFGGNVYYTD